MKKLIPNLGFHFQNEEGKYCKSGTECQTALFWSDERFTPAGTFDHFQLIIRLLFFVQGQLDISVRAFHAFQISKDLMLVFLRYVKM